MKGEENGFSVSSRPQQARGQGEQLLSLLKITDWPGDGVDQGRTHKSTMRSPRRKGVVF